MPIVLLPLALWSIAAHALQPDNVEPVVAVLSTVSKQHGLNHVRAQSKSRAAEAQAEWKAEAKAVTARADAEEKAAIALAQAEGTAAFTPTEAEVKAEAKVEAKVLEQTLLPRIRIAERSGRRVLVVGTEDQEVRLLGGNYVIKAAPWMPPVDVIRADAERLAAQASALTHNLTDAEGRPVLVRACVRLGAIFAAAMPLGPEAISEAWKVLFEQSVTMFQAAGVYVILDNHQDGLSSASGGEGLPLWMATRMQAAYPEESLTISPKHPMKYAVGTSIKGTILEKVLGLVGVEEIQTMPDDPSPWAAFAANNTQGDDPRLQAIANPSVRLNNNDVAWEQVRIVFTEQCQNLAVRFFDAHKTADKATLFDPYIEYIAYLASVWDRYSNVVAVELLNEPVFSGLPDLTEGLLTSRVRLFDWYEAVLTALEGRHIAAPIAYEDIFGGVGFTKLGWNSWYAGSSAFLNALSVEGIHESAKAKLREWAARNQLIFSFHYYGPDDLIFSHDLATTVRSAMAQAEDQGGAASMPLWCSEFGSLGPPAEQARQEQGKKMGELASLGVSMSTYWHLANTTWTQTEGWYRYDQGLWGDPLATLMGNATIEAKRALWDAYVATVRNGTSFGAQITGSNHGWEDVLPNVVWPSE